MRGLALTAVALLLVTVAVRGQQPLPRFRSGVEVIPVDVSVVDNRGRPVEGLSPADFVVRIDGQPRRVISADYRAQSTVDAPTAIVRIPEGFSSNETQSSGRLIVIAVDQPTIPFTAIAPVRRAVGEFIDRLTPSDRVALVGLGLQAPSVSFTNDFTKVKKALTRMEGQQTADRGMGFAVAMAIDRWDQAALNRVAARDCLGTSGRSRRDCIEQIQREAEDLALNARRDAQLSIGRLGALVRGLQGIDAPKTIVLISQGFLADTLQRGDGTSRLLDIASLAAAGRTSIYTIKLQELMDDATVKGRRVLSVSEEAGERRRGIETLAMATGGAYYDLTGTGQIVFDRLTSELSGSYLLAVESTPTDRNGRTHPITVTVPARGATVRTHRALLMNESTDRTRLPIDVVKAALDSPVIVSTLPLRAAAFVVRGTGTTLQLIVHADVGSGYTTRLRLPVGFVVYDARGRDVGTQLSEAQLDPASPNEPSSLAFNASASVEPGDYIVKIAVADRERVGTVEVPVHAALVSAGGTTLTPLVSGGAIPPGDLLRPTIGSRVASTSVQGYFEAYGPDLDAVLAIFEIASDESGPALLSEPVAMQRAGEQRAIFSRLMPVRLLPPGLYYLRAIVRAGQAPATTLARGFEIPASNDGLTGAMFLPVERAALSRPFRRSDALEPVTLQAFRERVPLDARELFDRGLSQLQNDRAVDAGVSFKDAMRPGPDGVAQLAFLAVCLATTDHDAEAAQLWQAAIAAGGDLPHIHRWLGDALMRTGAFGEARVVLERAARRWPADARFARPLALLYAMSGQAGDALRTIEQVVAADPSDADTLLLTLEWLFRLGRGGVAIHGADDLPLARKYAEAYATINGASRPLVELWMAYLEARAAKR